MNAQRPTPSTPPDAAPDEESEESELHSSTNISVLAARLAGVKPFPHIVAKIHSLAVDPTKTLGDVVEVVERDIAFATRMLRLANSPTTALRQRCTSVRHAVALLGLSRVANIATTTAAFAFLSEHSNSAPSIVKHAVTTGGVARALAPYAKVSSDEAFTVGLLHDVGMLLLLQLHEPLYEELIEQIGPNNEPTVDEEQALLGFDHASFGGHVLSRWKLPDPLPDVVALHHDWDAALARGGLVAGHVAVLRVAEVLSARLEARETPNESDRAALANEPALDYLGLTAPEVLRKWDSFREASKNGAEEPPPLAVEEFASTPPKPKTDPPRTLMMSLRPIADMLEPLTNYPRVPHREWNSAYVVLLVALVIGLLAAVAWVSITH